MIIRSVRYAFVATLVASASSSCVKSADLCERFPDEYVRADFGINTIRDIHDNADRIASTEIENCYHFHQYLGTPRLILKGTSSSLDGKRFLVYDVPGATDVEILFQFDAAGRVTKAYQQSTL
jgi:hypothetical protein